MKKIVFAAFLLILCWVVHPVSALAALEEIPLPPGSDQMAPIDQADEVSGKKEVPAQKSGAVQQKEQKPTAKKAHAVKAAKKKWHKSAAKKASKAKQKKHVKKAKAKKAKAKKIWKKKTRRTR
ncbi:MAG: hypothetical protein HQL87_15220 [Magnetococcales bacterium]|nr:hypothetical protein [Magnetococcales bacterium]